MSAAQVLPQVWAAALARPVPASLPEPIESLAFYRRHTEALLRKYLQKSLEMGRTPSILDNCMFRGKVSTYRMHSFEDMVIFVLDVDRCLKQLDKGSQELIARIALQEYSQGETATLTRQSLRSTVRRYGDAIDALTRIFLRCKLLDLER